MPLDIAVPTWYNDDSYINEKVDECNTIKFGAVEGEEFTPWTAASVRDFLAAANGEADYQPWMGYANFVSNGNAENCSPNPLFNVMQYVTAKAAQLNSINYDGRNADNNPWTAQNVLDFFNAHDITAWDHFTTAGQFENVNPSNAMDLSDFLASKAKECNDIEFDGRNDWDEQAVLDYYQEHGLNAVMVAVSASDPNVVAVPEAEQVTPPVGFTPWGVAVMPVDVELTTGVDVMPENEAPINYIGTVVNTNSSSTLNPNDQINGGNAADELTVNMDRSWIGFNDGFVKDVPTVNLNNETASGRNLNFNAENIEGVDTWNVNGNVSLSNLEKAGITVNLSNVNGDNPYNLNFDADAVKGGNDSLTLGINNMPEYVTVNGNGIEHVTVNSTGDVENYVWLKGMDGAKSVKITGDGEANVALSPTVTTIDATEAGADTFVCTRYSDLVESIRMGKGDDSFTLRSITPNAVVDGGDGQDTGKLYNTSGAYQLQMSNVETLNITVGKNYAGQATPDPTAALSLDGGLTTGLETLGLTGGNGYALDGTAAAARSISLSNYDVGELTVAVTKQNKVDLNITGIEEITVNVGDGKATDTANNVPLDQLTGTVTLPDAQNVAINIADINNPGNAQTEFDAALVAGKAGSLSLTSGQNAGIQIRGGDLSAVSQLTISGSYNTTIQNANLSQNAKSVYVDAQGQIGGTVTTSFTGNETNGGATLNYDGSTTGENDLTVDNTYSAINVVTGINSDTLTLNAVTGFKYTQQNLTGNLGSGDDTIVVKGTVEAGSDFTGLAGVETIKFEGMSTQDAQNYVADNNIKTGDAVIAGSFIAANDVDIESGYSGDIYGLGGDQTFQGVINTPGDMTLNGDTENGEEGKLIANFGTGDGDLDVQTVQNLTLIGGTLGAAINGTIASGKVQGNLTIDNTASTVADAIGAAGTALTVAATGGVAVTGNDVAESVFNLKVTQGATATIDSGAANGATVEVAGVAGNVDVTTGAGNDTVTVAVPNQGNLEVSTGAGDDAINVSSEVQTQAPAARAAGQTLSFDGGEGTNTVTFQDKADLTGWGDAIFTGIETVGYDKTFTVDANQLGGASITSGENATNLTINDNITDMLDLSGVGKGTTEVTMGKGAQVTLGAAADTIVLGSGVDAAEALNVEITGFSVSASDGDAISLDGFLGGIVSYGSAYAESDMSIAAVPVTGASVASSASAQTVTASDSFSNVALDGGEIYNFAAFEASDAEGVANLFASASSGGVTLDVTYASSDSSQSGGTASASMDDAKFFLESGSDAKILVVTGDGDSAQLWFIDNADTAGIQANEVMLIGTLSGVDASTVTADAFALGA